MEISILIDKGFDLASDFLGYLREGDERNERLQIASIERQKEFDSSILTAIQDVSHKLDLIAQDVTHRIFQKIENDNFEKLIGQIKTIRFALEFNDKGMLGTALILMMDQLEYSKSRISEGKTEWLAPWMMAESVRLIALQRVSFDVGSQETIQKESLKFRLNILNFTALTIVKKDGAPWQKISEFVEGRNEDLLRLLIAEENQDRKKTKSIEILLDDPIFETDTLIDEILISVGSRVQIGDILIRLECSKTTMDFISKKCGIVESISVKSGDFVKTGTTLMILNEQI